MKTKTKVQLMVELEKALKEIEAFHSSTCELKRALDIKAEAIKNTATESESRRLRIMELESSLDSLSKKYDALEGSSWVSSTLAKAAMGLGSWDWPVNTITMMPEDARRLRAQVAELKKVVGQIQSEKTASQSSPQA